MAKALELTEDTLTVVPHVPKAARKGSQPVAPREPLQVRWPAKDVKAAKLAAIQLDFSTVSDFMLACFHAYMKAGKNA
jgi:hypothetical protein